MAPAGLSILTTSFTEGRDRTKALGVWGAISGVAAAAGVFLGGVLSEGPGWRWVLFVNIPVCVLIVAAAFRLVPSDRRARSGTVDILGAVLVTAGMLLLVYALVKAPDAGWSTRHTIGELGTAAVLLLAFLVVERRTRQPLFSFSIFRYGSWTTVPKKVSGTFFTGKTGSEGAWAKAARESAAKAARTGAVFMSAICHLSAPLAPRSPGTFQTVTNRRNP